MPADVSAKVKQAREQLASGRIEAARATLLAALRQAPGDPPAMMLLSAVMLQGGQAAPALHYAEQAAAARPGDAAAHGAMGNALAAMGRAAAAAEAFRQAARLDPRRAEYPLAHAGALAAAHRLSESERACREGLAIHPREPRLSMMLGHVLAQMGRADEGAELLAAALRESPNDLDLAQALAINLNYVSRPDPRRALEAHRNYARLLDQRTPDRPDLRAPPPTPADAERPLRVGFVSPDLRSHAVSTFLEPLLENLPRDGFTVACYSTAFREDAVSARLKRRAAIWRHAPMMSAEDLARQVRRDAIDVLIDLAGHTSGHRLPLFALAPAPMQATWLGYPNTTGLSTIHFRIVDAHTDPPSPGGDADAPMTEHPLRLEPCFICYRPDPEAPDVNDPPCVATSSSSTTTTTTTTTAAAAAAAATAPSTTQPSGTGVSPVATQPLPSGGPALRAGSPQPPPSITFASFNTLAKLNGRSIALWSRIVNSIPGSRLLLKNKAFTDEPTRAAIAARFAQAGLAPGQLQLLPPTEMPRDHIAIYHRADIALDTFPYNGTTTTCEALWMGVPVVTMAGPVHAARVGVSLLHAAGLPELVAEDEAGYERIAIELARGTERLTQLRRMLRARLAASALCDGLTFGRAFAAAIRSGWRARCGISAG